MQSIVVAKPYKFVPPTRGMLWPALLKPFRGLLLKKEGVTNIECRGVGKLAASVSAAHGIILAPNHSRPGDPFAVAELGYAVNRPVQIMASWHLFAGGGMQSFLLRKVGAFSVFREGLDREALKCAIQIVADARRPLVLFPEGVISRHNDRLNSLMEGVSMIARSAAKQRAAASPGGKVVVHPVAIRYLFEGDLDATIGPMLEDIERRLTWRSGRDAPPVERITRIGSALLTLKEIEYLGSPGSGGLAERINHLIDRLLCPIEAAWVKGRREDTVVARVKLLRSALLPDLVAGQLAPAEEEARWVLLSQLYLAQQLAFYPHGYLTANPTPERILETVERFEEDLTDKVRLVSPIRALIDVGDAIEVLVERTRGGEDPLMKALRESLEALLAASLAERRPGSTLQ